MKRVTVALDDEVARWLRRLAADQEISVSRLVGDLLRREMAESSDYEAAMAQYLSQPAVALGGRARYPSREELHDRGGPPEP